MQVVESQFEILRISKTVGLPLEGFYFVDQTLDYPADDAMLEVILKSCSPGREGFANPFERLDPGGHGIMLPHGE